MPDLTVTLVQSDIVWQDVDSNLSAFAARIGTLKSPTDLIVLPEMFSTGFSMRPAQLAEPMDGKAVAWLREMAVERRAVVTGSLMIAERGRFYNRLVWARPDGALAVYDKKHLFAYAGEDKVYTAGRAKTTETLKGWRIRLFICYDLRFPVWTRNVGNAYDLALFVANWPAKRSAHWRALLRARAIENQAYVIGVNRVGTDGNGFYHDGHSAVIAPAGEVLFEEADREAVHTIRLSREALEGYRARFPAWKDADGPEGLADSAGQ